MQLSAAGLDLIKRSEGFRSQVYRDLAGLATVGYGHRILSQESFSSGVTEPEAAVILACDVVQAEQAVGRLVKVPLTQGQFDALTDFCFNLGAERLASSTLLELLNSAHFDAARQQLLQWDLANGHVARGLRVRRQADFEIWGSPSIDPDLAA